MRTPHFFLHCWCSNVYMHSRQIGFGAGSWHLARWRLCPVQWVSAHVIWRSTARATHQPLAFCSVSRALAVASCCDMRVIPVGHLRAKLRIEASFSLLCFKLNVWSRLNYHIIWIQCLPVGLCVVSTRPVVPWNIYVSTRNSTISMQIHGHITLKIKAIDVRFYDPMIKTTGK